MRSLHVLSALSLFACSFDPIIAESPPSNDAQYVDQAISALTQRDEDAVKNCRGAEQRCSDRIAAGANGAVCARIAGQCDLLEARLATMRDPAERCWHQIKLCELEGLDNCREHAAACLESEAQAAESRSNVLDCSETVRACLDAAADDDTIIAMCGALDALCADINDELAKRAAETPSDPFAAEPLPELPEPIGPSEAEEPQVVDDPTEADPEPTAAPFDPSS